MNAAVEKLFQMVKEKGSQRALAEQLGISPSYLNDILCERKGVSEEVANKLGFRWMLIPDDPRMEAYLKRFKSYPEGTKA